MAVTNYWKLDDNAASTTVVATTGSNGTLNGGDNTSAKASTGPGGSVTYSFLLNGTDDSVTISGASIAAGSAGSIEAWFKIGTLTTNMAIVGSSSSTNNRISVFDNTTIRVRTSADMNFTVPALGTGWHHLLVTKTSANLWRVFIDGVESSTAGQTSAVTFTPTRIGLGSLASNQFFTGSLSNVRFHDTDESANVSTLFAAGVDAPSITLSGDPFAVSVLEGRTAVTTVTATGVGITYSISGTDSARFSIVGSTGVLTFSSAPDYETPLDANADNVYELTATATNVAGSSNRAIRVTVTDYPATRISLGQFPVRTTNGSESYTISGLGDSDRIKAVFRWGNLATANGTAVNGAHYSYGVFTPTVDDTAVAVRFENGATTDVEGHVSVEYWRKITALNATEALATLTGFTTDGITVNVSTAPATAMLNQLMFFAGDDVQAEIQTGLAADQGLSLDLSFGFTPTLLIVIQADDGFSTSTGHQGFAPHTTTFISRDGSGTVESACLSTGWNHVDSTTTTCYGTVSTSSVYWDPARTTAGPENEYSFSFPSSTTLRITTDVHRGIDNPNTFAVLALRFGSRKTQVGIATLGTSTGVQNLTLDPAPAFTPDTFCCLPSRITAVDTNRSVSAEAGVAGIAAVTRPSGFSAGNGEYCATVAAENGAATTNSQSLVASKLIAIPDHTGANLVEAAFDSFGSGSVAVNVTSAPLTAIVMPYFAIEGATSSGGSGGGAANLLLLGVG